MPVTNKLLERYLSNARVSIGSGDRFGVLKSIAYSLLVIAHNTEPFGAPIASLPKLEFLRNAVRGGDFDDEVCAGLDGILAQLIMNLEGQEE